MRERDELKLLLLSKNFGEFHEHNAVIVLDGLIDGVSKKKVLFHLRQCVAIAL